MRGFRLALAAALLASLAFNVILYRKADSDAGPETRPRGRETSHSMGPASSSGQAPSAAPADSSQLMAEIRQLRSDLAAARGAPLPDRSSSSGDRASSRKVQEDLAPAIAQDPVVVNALAERDAIRHSLQKYWRDVDRVYEVREAIGLPKYRETVARLTADVLGFDPSSASGFITASIQSAQDFDRAEAERKEAEAKLKASVPDKESRKRLEDGIDARYAELKAAAIARLEPYLQGTSLQQDLRGKSGGRYLEYLRGR